MSYAKYIGTASPYQGTSLSISLGKDDDAEWSVNEVGDFFVTNELNERVLEGVLIKSVDNLTLNVLVGKSDCVNWEGEHRLLAFQTNTDNLEIKVPIADYSLTYLTTKAG